MLNTGHRPVWELQPVQDLWQRCSAPCPRKPPLPAPHQQMGMDSQIHSSKLLQSSAGAEPPETCGSCKATTTHTLTTQLPIGLGRALKMRGGCFTWQMMAPTRQHKIDLYRWCHAFLPSGCCGAMCQSSLQEPWALHRSSWHFERCKAEHEQ